jgi:Transglutaminase-like superfamily
MRFRPPKLLSFPRLGWLTVALFLLPITTAALRIFGFQRTHKFMAIDTVAQFSGQLSARNSDIDNIVYALHAIENRIYEFNCLSRALVAWFLLSMRGVESTIRYGVRKGDDEASFASHAWLEIDGRIVIGGEGSAQSYVPLEFPNKPID